MGWATLAINQLKNGETVKINPRGGSMSGRIESGDTVIIEPLKENPQVDDIVLCKVNGNQYLHIVKAVDGNGKRFLIGNNRGGINGWISRNSVFGVATKVNGRYLRQSPAPQ